MKKILITGVNSYVGNSLHTWLQQWPDTYSVDLISLKDGSWKDKDFSSYDSIVHVAGFVHRKETKDNERLYYEINRDLTDELARKTKCEGVRHFTFLSTMSVYGLNQGIIDEKTPLHPTTHYGKSKLEAEGILESLADDNFSVAIIRPPMIYGKGCKGNYQRLRKLALKTPIFPDVDNKRSMIYIDNLSKFLKGIIDNTSVGLYFPQNKEYVNTTEMVKVIAEIHNKKVYTTKLFNPIIKILNSSILNKAFGDLRYSKTTFKNLNPLSKSFVELKKSIKLTEE